MVEIAADALQRAQRVYILGAGSSLALATFLSHYFRLVFDTVHLVEATSEATILQQMIHAGDPVQYANINTSYWTEHFYAFGRISTN